jgi:hypothetical protein
MKRLYISPIDRIHAFEKQAEKRNASPSAKKSAIKHSLAPKATDQTRYY